jgi:cytochrome c oxidase assembly factor CtaG
MSSFKYTFDYMIGMIFTVGIMVYLYLFIDDRKENAEHTVEEKIWIYIFLCILLIGVFFSYYSIIADCN